MASVDGSKSIYAASDETFDHMCGPCRTEGNEKEARKYCENCLDYLCDTCVAFHDKLPSIRDHNIVSAHEVSVGAGRRLTVYCRCNNNQEVEIYCEDHSETICKQCQLILHHRCKTMHIQQRSSGYTLTKLDSVLRKMKSLKDKYDQLKENCSEDKKELSKTTEECRKEIVAFRKELDEYVDKLEQEMLAELRQFETKEHQHIDKKILTLSTAMQILDVDYQLLNDAKNDARKHVMFAADLQISKRFRECESRLAELEKEAVKLSLAFERNSKLDDLLSNKNFQLGSLKLLEKALKKSDHTVLLGRQIQWCREVNVRLDGDRRSPSISGLAFMPNGYVVICDSENGKIKLLDTSLTLMDSMHFSGLPSDVSHFDDNNVIVTIYTKKQLQIMQIFPQLKTGSVFQLDKYCFGVAVSGDNIFVSCHNNPGEGEVRILDKQGNIQHRLGVTKTGSFLFSTPYYITVNRTGDKVFVSDSSITCMKVDSSIIYTYKDEDLLKPQSLYCDGNDNVLVCDRDSNNVQIIDVCGGKAGTILTAEDGLKKPCSVTFMKSQNKLVVGCYKMNSVFVYNLMV